MAHHSRLKSALAVAGVGLLAATTACGSSSKSGTSSPDGGSSAASSSGGSSSSALDAAAKRTAQYESADGAGTFESKQLGPVKPPKGLSISFVAAEAAAPGVAVDINGLKEAAGLLGYSVNVCSGGGTVPGTQGCIETSIRQKPAAIINQAFNPSLISSQIADAKKAGILVIGQFDGQTDTKIEDGLVGGNVCVQQGQILGDAIASKSAGKAHVLLFNDPAITCLGQRNDGITTALKADCPDSCKSKTISIQVAEASAIPGTIHSALTANPDINWIVGPTDFISLDAANEVRQSGKVGSVSVGGFDADAPNLKAMKSEAGQAIQKFDVVAADTMLGYLGVDLIVRLKTKSNVPGGTLHPSIKIFTPDNVGGGGGYHGPAGYQDEFKKLWGVK